MAIYVYIDGDNIGRMVGHATLINDDESAAKISQAINDALNDIKILAFAHGGHIISSGGDEVVIKFDKDYQEGEPEIYGFIKKIADHAKDYYGFTITAGIGPTLSTASKALMAGKLNGKNQVVEYSKEVDQFIDDAQSGRIKSKEGKLDHKEFKKLYEEYLKFLDEKEKRANEEPKYETIQHPELGEEIVVDEEPIHRIKEWHFKEHLKQQQNEGQDDDVEEKEKYDMEDWKEDEKDEEPVRGLDEDVEWSGKLEEESAENERDEEEKERVDDGKVEERRPLKFTKLHDDLGGVNVLLANKAQEDSAYKYDTKAEESRDDGKKDSRDDRVGAEDDRDSKFVGVLPKNQVKETEQQGQEVREEQEQEQGQQETSQYETGVEGQNDLSAFLNKIKDYVSVFKQRAPELESLKESDPELYKALLGILSDLIESVSYLKALSGIAQEGGGNTTDPKSKGRGSG